MMIKVEKKIRMSQTQLIRHTSSSKQIKSEIHPRFGVFEAVFELISNKFQMERLSREDVV
jgi:hypothetical protein